MTHRIVRWVWLGVLFTAGQFLLLVVAFYTGMTLLLAPLWPGLRAMQLLPADPRSAGSYIVLPTLSQTVLALVVNDLMFGLILKLVNRIRRR